MDVNSIVGFCTKRLQGAAAIPSMTRSRSPTVTAKYAKTRLRQLDNAIKTDTLRNWWQANHLGSLSVTVSGDVNVEDQIW